MVQTSSPHCDEVEISQLAHDGVVHHPLGGASYYFRENLVQYISARCPHDRICVHVGAQPNSVPHLGNSVTFATAFALAAALRQHTQKTVEVKFVYVDTAPSSKSTETIDGIIFQRSLGDTREIDALSPSFQRGLQALSSVSDIPFSTSTQEIWRSHRRFTRVLKYIIERREELGRCLSPDTKALCIRAPCPIEGCNRADKHGALNDYAATGKIWFNCWLHGRFVINLDSQRDLARLGFNTPLRNFIRVMLCSQDKNCSQLDDNTDPVSWVMCTGADYAGLYQEQFLWRLLPDAKIAPIIFYAPLIVDWSGVKLSKSMYVQHGAYSYLKEKGLDYIVNGDVFFNLENSANALYCEVESWFSEPYRLFRNYSVEYMHKQLTKRGVIITDNTRTAKDELHTHEGQQVTEKSVSMIAG